jgi:hypothetical protein
MTSWTIVNRKWALCLWITLLVSASADAALFTVGPGGTHSDLQAAIDATITPGDDEIRIAAELTLNAPPYFLLANATHGSLRISGGWSADFLSVLASSTDAMATVIHGVNAPAPIRIAGSSGLLELSRIKIQNGNATGFGASGALEAILSGSAELRLYDLWITTSVTSESQSCVDIRTLGSVRLQIDALRVTECETITTANLRASAMSLLLSGNSFGTVTRVQLDANSAFATNSVSAATAMSVQVFDTAALTLDQVEIARTKTETPNVAASALRLEARDTAQLRATRLNIHDNTAMSAPASTPQFAMNVGDSAVIRLSDSLIYSGPQTGLGYSLFGSAPRLHMCNLTIATHAARGLVGSFTPGATVSLHNSIVSQNGQSSVSQPGSNNLGANLGLPEPLFVSATPLLTADFRLRSDSPGIDAGTAMLPFPLTTLDFAGNPRVSGNAVDIGAYELISDRLFANGFE